MMATKYTLYECYHGTDAILAKTILDEGFVASRGTEHWLGEGVYFFIDGVSSGEDCAHKWAICNAWDNNSKSNKYEKFAVIMALFESNAVLDLRDDECLRVFDELRNELINKIHSLPDIKRKIRGTTELDHYVATKLSEMMEVDAMIGSFYVKLTKVQRKMAIGSRIPNCTMLCVRERDMIDKALIQVVLEDNIEGLAA